MPLLPNLAARSGRRGDEAVLDAVGVNEEPGYRAAIRDARDLRNLDAVHGSGEGRVEERIGLRVQIEQKPELAAVGCLVVADGLVVVVDTQKLRQGQPTGSDTRRPGSGSSVVCFVRVL